jgi:hypothetical protein
MPTHNAYIKEDEPWLIVLLVDCVELTIILELEL